MRFMMRLRNLLLSTMKVSLSGSIAFDLKDPDPLLFVLDWILSVGNRRKKDRQQTDSRRQAGRQR